MRGRDLAAICFESGDVASDFRPGATGAAANANGCVSARAANDRHYHECVIGSDFGGDRDCVLGCDRACPACVRQHVGWALSRQHVLRDRPERMVANDEWLSAQARATAEAVDSRAVSPIAPPVAVYDDGGALGYGDLRFSMNVVAGQRADFLKLAEQREQWSLAERQVER